MKQEHVNLENRCQQGLEAMRAETAPAAPADDLVRAMRLAQAAPTRKPRTVRVLAYATPAAAAAVAVLFWPQSSYAYSQEDVMKAAQNKAREIRMYTVGPDGKKHLVSEGYVKGEEWQYQSGKKILKGDGDTRWTVRGSLVSRDQQEKGEPARFVGDLQELTELSGVHTSDNGKKVIWKGQEAIKFESFTVTRAEPGKEAVKTTKTIFIDPKTKAPLAVTSTKSTGEESVVEWVGTQAASVPGAPAAAPDKVYDLPAQRKALAKLTSGEPQFTDNGLGLHTVVADPQGNVVLLMRSADGPPVTVVKAWINNVEMTPAKPKFDGVFIAQPGKVALKEEKVVKGEPVMLKQSHIEFIYKADKLVIAEEPIMLDPKKIKLIGEEKKPVFRVWLNPTGEMAQLTDNSQVIVKVKLANGEEMTFGTVVILFTPSVSELFYGAEGNVIGETRSLTGGKVSGTPGEFKGTLKPTIEMKGTLKPRTPLKGKTEDGHTVTGTLLPSQAGDEHSETAEPAELP